MSRTRFVTVALLTMIAAAQVTLGADPRDHGNGMSSRDLFQWYIEWDNVNFGANPPAIVHTVPQGRVAVIDFVTFSASQVQCPLTGVTVMTTFRGRGSNHTVVGVVDLGTDNVGRHYGLSQPALVYASGGEQVTAVIHGIGNTADCPGDGGDFTVTGHLLPR